MNMRLSNSPAPKTPKPLKTSNMLSVWKGTNEECQESEAAWSSPTPNIWKPSHTHTHTHTHTTSVVWHHLLLSYCWCRQIDDLMSSVLFCEFFNFLDTWCSCRPWCIAVDETSQQYTKSFTWAQASASTAANTWERKTLTAAFKRMIIT